MKKLLGRIAAERVLMLEVPRTDPALLEQIKEIGDPTSTISDVMDSLGIVGAVVMGSQLRATLSGAVAVGPALTVRNVMLDVSESTIARAARNQNTMAEIEAHNICSPGDFLVIQGVSGISNMGGVSAEIAKREGSVGAVVSGAVRDVEHSRSVGYPVWSSEVSPITGKWRIETVEINGTVEIFGVRVAPGDIVVADETGVCFIPRERAIEVIEIALKKHKAEGVRLEAVRAGVPILDLPRPA